MPTFYKKLNTNINNVLESNAITLGTPDELADADTLYFSGKNIDSYTPRFVGQTIAETSMIEGYGGYKHLLRNVSTTGSDMRIGFSGTDIEIEKLYVLKKLFEFDDDEFMKIDMGHPERGAVIHEDLYYDLSKVKGYFKRRVGYTAEAQGLQKLREFEIFRMTDDAVEFVFLEDFTHFPDRMYDAILDPEFDMKFNILVKSEGLDLDFVIRER